MKFDSPSVRAMESSLDAQWLKMRVTLNNLANSETPGYKTRSVDFSQVLSGVKCESPMHGGTHDIGPTEEYRATILTDEHTESRVDGNNVNVEKEQLELWRAQAQYSYLTQRVNGHYSNLRNVISQMSK